MSQSTTSQSVINSPCDHTSLSTQNSSVNIQHGFDLSHDNTMALCCIAKQAVILDDESQVAELFASLSVEQKILILSGGSNVILPSQLSALAILPRYQGVHALSETDDTISIEVMAGNNWHELVVHCTQQGWFGLENLALIPGLVGASPVQNIGAYGVQLEDCLKYVKAFHIPTKTWQTLSKEACQFAYRDSIFKQNPHTWLISRVAFTLHKNSQQLVMNYGDVATQAQALAQQNSSNSNNNMSNSSEAVASVTPLDVMNAIISIRQSKLPDPQELANTGSFFQNPIIERRQYETLLEQFADMPKYDINETKVKVPAGWLIDKAGLKGQGIAPILTHSKQALVLTNHAPRNASQQDIANTRDLIIERVQQRYGITLHAEPVWIAN